MRMGYRKRVDWKWMEEVKNAVYSFSEMNVLDGVGRVMELQRERNDHSSMLFFFAHIAILMDESSIAVD